MEKSEYFSRISIALPEVYWSSILLSRYVTIGQTCQFLAIIFGRGIIDMKINYDEFQKQCSIITQAQFRNGFCLPVEN